MWRMRTSRRLLSARGGVTLLLCLVVILAGCNDQTPEPTPEGPTVTDTIEMEGPWLDPSNASYTKFRLIDGDETSYVTLESTPHQDGNTTLNATVEYPDGSVVSGTAVGPTVAPGDISLIGRISTGTGNATLDNELRGTVGLAVGLLTYADHLAGDQELAVGASWTPPNETETMEIVGTEVYEGVGCYVGIMPFPAVSKNATLTACLTGTGAAPQVAIEGEYYRLVVELAEYRRE